MSPLGACRHHKAIKSGSASHWGEGEISMRKAAAFFAAILGIGALSAAVAQSVQVPLVPHVESAPPPKPPATPTAGTPQLTAQDVNAWLDGFMSYSLAKDDIAGAVVVVVKDGQILTQKGYGYADVAAHKPVDPAKTLFRPGSVSKLFTWTAVMQLVEQGKLDLDKDVNTYLDFKIPATYAEPITLRHIMTHTSGFEEVIKDLFVRDASQLRPLRDYVVNHVPRRIFPPGKIPAYSNYATALAGYIVERVSGKPYNDYVRDSILLPLGMNHSTFVQ